MNLQTSLPAFVFAFLVLNGPWNGFAVADDKSEIDRLAALAEQAIAEQQWDRAIELYTQVYDLEKSVFGEPHVELLGTLDLLAQLAEVKQADQAVVAYRERQQVMTEKLFGTDDYRTQDAVRTVANAKQRAAFTPEQKALLAQAVALHSQMMQAYQAGNYAEGIQAATECLDIRKQVLGDQHSDYASSLNNLAALYKSIGEYSRAEPLYRQAIALGATGLGKRHPDYAIRLNNLAALYKSIGDYRQAEPLYRQSIEILKNLGGDANRDYALSLNNLAGLYRSMGDYPQAEPLYREAIELHERVLGKKHPDYATSLNNLAGLYSSMGDYLRAEPLYREAIEIQEEVLGKRHPIYAISLNNLAELCRLMGDYPQAESLYREALEIREQVLGKQHPSYANSLNNLAALYYTMGDYTQAEPPYREAMAIQEELLGKQHPDYAISLNNLAELYRSMGDYARAEPLYREAVTIRENSLGKRHPDYATSLNNLASLYDSMGDYPQAESLYREATGILKELLGNDHPDYATSLNNLAALYYAMGEFPRAVSLYREAMAIREKVPGKAHPDYAVSLNNLALLYEAMGDYPQAESLHRETMEIWEKVLGKRHPIYTISLNNLAELHRLMGDYPQAESLYREALEIREQVLGKQHPDYALSLSNLAVLYRSMGDYQRAEPLCREAVEITLDSLELTADVQSQRQQVAMGESLRYHLDNYLSLAAQEPQFQPSAYAALLRWKGSVWQRQQRGRLLIDEPALKPGFAELRDVSSKLSTLILRNPDPRQLDAWRRQLDELTDQREKLQRDLSLASAAFRQASTPVTPDQLRASLPVGTMLLDFLEYTRLTPADKQKQTKHSWERHLVVHLVRADQEVLAIDLGPVERIDEWVQTWRSDFGQSRATAEAATQLRNQIWQPLAERLTGITMVYVSPDGALGQFPLGALPGKTPGTYLLEELAIVMLPVPQGLPAMMQSPARSTDTATDRFCLVGGVDYGKVVAPREPSPAAPLILAARGNQPNVYQPLPGTVGEIETIESLLRVHRPSATATILRGAQASEAAFASAAPGHRYLHVATHGFFAPQSVQHAWTASTPDIDRKLGSDESRSPRLVGQHPDLLSGLVFAGANHTSEGTADDGILTAAEVQSLDLRGVELAILSACETGLGATAGGEGIIGLQRAFQLAGVETTITSLWQVDDAATRALMVEFYRNLFERQLGKLESLRQAQLTMLNRYEPTTGGFTRGLGGKSQQVGITDAVPPATPANRVSPALWAAFQLSGDPR